MAFMSGLKKHKSSGNVFNGPIAVFPAGNKSAEEHLRDLSSKINPRCDFIVPDSRVKNPPTIHIFNKVDAVNYVPVGKKAIAIRITDHNQEFVSGFKYAIYKDVLELRFQDSDPEYLFTPSLMKLLFQKEHAEKIVDLISKNMDADELVINCDYGQSRSVATALSVSKILYNSRNSDFIEDVKMKIDSGKYAPNKWILSQQEIFFNEIISI